MCVGMGVSDPPTLPYAHTQPYSPFESAPQWEQTIVQFRPAKRAAALGPRRHPDMSIDRSSEINWLEWGDEALELADRDDKLIVLCLTAPWCHWCHVMDRTTYSNSEVINFINEKFVPIRVNGDKRPDIQDRYLLGGWPTTAFLLPDGRMLSGSTYMPPEAMILKLQEVHDLYHEHRQLVTTQAASMQAVAEADRAEAETPISGFAPGYIEKAVKVLRRDFDELNGGFGKEPKFPFPDAVHFAFHLFRNTGDEHVLRIALRTLDGMMSLQDPVWGGLYRYGMISDWSSPHYEKLLCGQAGAIENYTEAFQVTGYDRYGEAAAGIKGYVDRFLSDHERGGFYASQDADVGSHDPDADIIFGDAFFPLDEAGRLSVGMPHVDRTMYTDWNGMMISAYLRLYHVMGDEHARDFALKTADRLLTELWADGRMCHCCDLEAGLCGVLSDHVHFGQALVDAYQTTGKRTYLTHAEVLAEFMAANLQDVVDGGFYFQIFDPHIKGAVLERHKPFDENVTAALFLTRLYYLTGKKDYQDQASKTLRALQYPQFSNNIVGVGYAHALDLFMNRPLHIVLVGAKENEETKQMLAASLQAYEPSKLVQLLDPAEDDLTVGDITYEASDIPMAYVCVRNVCQPPVRGRADLELMLNGMEAKNHRKSP